MSGPGPFQDKPSLRVESLTLARGERTLLRDFGFAAGPGGFVEIRGGNGAGKTTLLRAIAGFLKPRAGAIAFEGVEEPSLALHYVGHLNGLKGGASVLAHLRYWAGLFGAAPREEEALTRLGLRAQAELPARVLSQGQARRLALARLVAAPRPVWLLDEPAAGLDAQGRGVLSALIEAHRAEGGVVVAAVHEALGPAPSQTLTVGA
ncbi:MAG: heme ABC exporter ATP-binding protein CcmA [Hyphomonadaceae bacterium]|nr:heme ABC exporter ATP-binding protein CcmA [Hyphomonadaceae bacterium]GIK50597.1 MAG: cytochrome c biogenesis ATP-binding export protein CcmA [Alphaproteobacteria bacterium]